MTLDFQQLNHQVRKMGEDAPLREENLRNLRQEAMRILAQNADDLERLRNKVFRTASQVSNLRCAFPLTEPLNAAYDLPQVDLNRVGIIAADGSQITPSAQDVVDYYLINVGAVQLHLGKKQPPREFVESRLYYGDELYVNGNTISENLIYLKRDLREREFLGELSAAWQTNADASDETEDIPETIVALTDGPLELWRLRDSGAENENRIFTQYLEAYLKALKHSYKLGTLTGGYVDKPRADLVVRLLDIAVLPENELDKARSERRFVGVTDAYLFQSILSYGQRSAIFGLQSRSADEYKDKLALRFFYINVGRAGKPALARVEIPAWVADNPPLLDTLHATLVTQAKTLGSRPYPYLLHRAHEVAVVTREEKEQLTNMIVQEFLRRRVYVGEVAPKQALKDTPKRTRY